MKLEVIMSQRESDIKLASLRAERLTCDVPTYGTRPEALAACTIGRRPFLCQRCYRWHTALSVPHRLPGAGR